MSSWLFEPLRAFDALKINKNKNKKQQQQQQQQNKNKKKKRENNQPIICSMLPLSLYHMGLVRYCVSVLCMANLWVKGLSLQTDWNQIYQITLIIKHLRKTNKHIFYLFSSGFKLNIAPRLQLQTLFFLLFVFAYKYWGNSLPSNILDFSLYHIPLSFCLLPCLPCSLLWGQMCLDFLCSSMVSVSMRP